MENNYIKKGYGILFVYRNIYIYVPVKNSQQFSIFYLFDPPVAFCSACKQSVPVTSGKITVNPLVGLQIYQKECS
jgi:hypothetical protein